MRILAREGRGIAAVLDRLNRLILDEGPRGRFITLVHGEIITARAGATAPAGTAAANGSPERAPVAKRSLVCAGHPLPPLLRERGAPEPALIPAPPPRVRDHIAV